MKRPSKPATASVASVLATGAEELAAGRAAFIGEVRRPSKPSTASVLATGSEESTVTAAGSIESGKALERSPLVLCLLAKLLLDITLSKLG